MLSLKTHLPLPFMNFKNEQTKSHMPDTTHYYFTTTEFALAGPVMSFQDGLDAHLECDGQPEKLLPLSTDG